MVAFQPHNSFPYPNRIGNGDQNGKYMHNALLVPFNLMSSSFSKESSTNFLMSQSSLPMQSKTVMETDTVLTTKASVIDKNLNENEKNVVDVVRRCESSVAYVSSSILPPTSSRRRSRMRKSEGEKRSEDNRSEDGRSGRPLGSGSAFCISSEGYFITNYHVIEQAYLIQQNRVRAQQFISNVTQPFMSATKPNNTTSPLTSLLLDAQVYLRLSPSGSSTVSTPNKFQPCRIVAVRPEVDIAILHLPIGKDGARVPALPYGSSTSLLVGQTVLAIGNPFGLSQTLTTGVVSALDRSFPSSVTLPNGRKKDIRGCVQTDAAINPGNSGGPLLDAQGKVVGVNAAIISPSGASAGIGFAIGMDAGLRGSIEDLIEADLETVVRVGGRKRGWLGASLVEKEGLADALWRKMKMTSGDDFTSGKSKNRGGVFVLEVKDGSPAQKAGIESLQYVGDGKVQIGDRIIAVGGNIVKDSIELTKDLKSRIVGEKISVTVEDRCGERRIVYITLGEKVNE